MQICLAGHHVLKTIFVCKESFLLIPGIHIFIGAAISKQVLILIEQRYQFSLVAYARGNIQAGIRRLQLEETGQRQ